MKRVLGAVVAALMISAGSATAVFAQPTLLKTLSSSIPHAYLFGLSLDQGKGVAVGAYGLMMESDDAGQTWKQVADVPTQLALLAVTKRGDHTIAVGQSGVVLVKKDNKWQAASSGSTARLLSVDVNSSGLAIAGGQFGTVLKSTDGGQTWTSTAPDWTVMASEEHFGTQEPMVYAVSVHESGQITIAGEYGLMMRSTDAGQSWTVIRPIVPGAPTIHGLYLPEQGGNGYAVGQTGLLLMSDNGGSSWTRCDTGTELNFHGVAASPSGQVVITGMRVMFRSENNGASWTNLDEGDITTDWYHAIRTEQGSGRIMAVGHSGKVIQIGS